jgi:hypothetical protein
VPEDETCEKQVPDTADQRNDGGKLHPV